MSTPSFDLRDLSSPVASTKFASAKKLMALAQTNPRVLYPHLEFFFGLMKSDNQMLKWSAIRIVGHLAAYDTEARIEKIMPQLYAQLAGGSMITANNTVAALSDIAISKPSLRKRIIKELLKVERYDYDTVECRNITIGKVIMGLQRVMPDIHTDADVFAFVTRQTTNTRPATGAKAELYLKKSTKAS